jgi:hypothetical protein
VGCVRMSMVEATSARGNEASSIMRAMFCERHRLYSLKDAKVFSSKKTGTLVVERNRREKKYY